MSDDAPCCAWCGSYDCECDFSDVGEEGQEIARLRDDLEEARIVAALMLRDDVGPERKEAYLLRWPWLAKVKT